jgi:L-ascorbate metabolism protein UlaG (beta-lactamase superfamily)
MNRIINDDTIVICPKRCRKIVKKWNARGLRPGEQTEIDDINIGAVPAYTRLFHNKLFFNWIGYIISDGAQRIYHAGDTYYIPEMEKFPEIDYAFLPIGGIYTMGMKGAMKTAKVIKAKHVIPMHERKKDIHEFKELLETRYPLVEVHALQKRSSSTI